MVYVFQCGKQLAVSLLDQTGNNTGSRLPQSQYGSLVGLRAWLHHFLTSSSLSPRTTTSVGVNVNSSRTPTAKTTPRGPTTRQQQGKISIERLGTAVKSSGNNGPRLGVPKQGSPSTPTSPRPGRNRSGKVRRHSWCMTVDAENQEPHQMAERSSHMRPNSAKKSASTGGITSRPRTKNSKKQGTSKKSNVARSLTFTELGESSHLTSTDLKLSGSKMATSKHGLTANVSLTPNLNVKLSISETAESPTLVKKVEKIRRQRSKGVNGGSKKLKTSPSCSSTSEDSSLKSKDSFFGLPNIEGAEYMCSPLSPSQQDTFYPNNQSPLSPRSPLSSVCEPQASHSSPTGLGVITTSASCDLHLQPKSPVMVTAKKVYHSPSKRSSKHSLKSLSKSMDRLPAVAGASGDRLKLLPKKMKKKVGTRSVTDLSKNISSSAIKPATSQPTLEWIISEPPKALAADIDIVAPKVKKRKKCSRKSL